MEEKVVLVIEEEPHTLKAFEDFLQKEHFRMLAAPSLKAGRALLKQRRVDLLIVDLGQPDAALFSDIHRLRRRYPDLPIILTSSMTELRYNKDFKKLQLPLLPKPIDIYELRQTVQQLVQNPNLNQIN